MGGAGLRHPQGWQVVTIQTRDRAGPGGKKASVCEEGGGHGEPPPPSGTPICLLTPPWLVAACMTFHTLGLSGARAGVPPAAPWRGAECPPCCSAPFDRIAEINFSIDADEDSVSPLPRAQLGVDGDTVVGGQHGETGCFGAPGPPSREPLTWLSPSGSHVLLRGCSRLQPSAALFEACCSDHIQPFDDDEEDDIWEDKEMHCTARVTARARCEARQSSPSLLMRRGPSQCVCTPSPAPATVLWAHRKGRPWDPLWCWLL